MAQFSKFKQLFAFKFNFNGGQFCKETSNMVASKLQGVYIERCMLKVENATPSININSTKTCLGFPQAIVRLLSSLWAYLLYDIWGIFNELYECYTANINPYILSLGNVGHKSNLTVLFQSGFQHRCPNLVRFGFGSRIWSTIKIWM